MAWIWFHIILIVWIKSLNYQDKMRWKEKYGDSNILGRANYWICKAQNIMKMQPQHGIGKPLHKAHCLNLQQLVTLKELQPLLQGVFWTCVKGRRKNECTMALWVQGRTASTLLCPKILWGSCLAPAFSAPLPRSPLGLKVAVVVGWGQREGDGLRIHLGLE